VADMLARGLADQYFFIRYWERGPHLRLRFRGEVDVLERELKPEIDACFNDYMRRHPTTREGWAVEAATLQNWYPNDSIQYVTYEPEIERYGGDVGMPIGERQFQASSNAVLAAISESDNWDYERALGAAIQLHLAYAHGLGLALADLTSFFALVAEGWLPRAYPYDEKTSIEEHQNKRGETLKAFESTYSEQKEMLVAFVATLWQALNEGVSFEQEWLNTWHAEMKLIGKDLGEAHRAGELTMGMYNQRAVERWKKHDQKQPWLILESYVHMTNNRLGILNMDEAFLGYLIKETVAAL